MATERELQEIAHHVWEDDGGRVRRLVAANEQETQSLAYQLRQEDGELEGKPLRLANNQKRSSDLPSMNETCRAV